MSTRVPMVCAAVLLVMGSATVGAVGARWLWAGDLHEAIALGTIHNRTEQRLRAQVKSLESVLAAREEYVKMIDRRVKMLSAPQQ